MSTNPPDFTPELMRTLELDEALATHEQIRRILESIRSQVRELIDEQQPLRDARVAAIAARNWDEATRLHLRVREIGAEIRKLHDKAAAQLEVSQELAR